MNILWMGRRCRVAGVAVGAALSLAGVPGYGGDGGAAAVVGNAFAQNGHGAADVYHIVNLEPGQGYRSRINTRGQAAYEYVNLNGRLRVGFFDGEQMSDISPPGAETAALGDMNEKGEVAEHASLPYGGSFTLTPFRWSRTAGWMTLPVLSPDWPSFTAAINDRGVIAGASASGPSTVGYRTVRWGPGNRLQALPAPAGFGESTAGDINEHGFIVGNAAAPGGLIHTFFWDPAGRPTDLGTFGASQAAGAQTNNRGEIAGWLDLFDANFQAFLWSPGQGAIRAGLHTLPGELNNVGEIVGRIYNPDTGIDHAYVFSRARGLVDLHRTPFTSSDAADVDDRGTVVGEMLSNIPGSDAQRAYRWARNGEAVDLNSRVPDAPDGLVLTQALRIAPTGDIIANSNAGLVLLRRAGGTDAPVLGPIRLPEVLQTTQPYVMTLSFRDRNTRDTHSATVDWGDGSGPQPVGVSERKGRGELSAAHTFAIAGDYTIITRVTDSSGRTTTQARHVNVFQRCVPGIVGEGSLPAALDRVGQPTLLFRLAAPLVGACGKSRPFTFVLQGRVAFEGDKLELVSRNGNTVRLEGSGKLGGESGYRFIVEARDGQHAGATDADRLTVRIEHAAAGAALAGSARPAVLSYGIADGKQEAAWTSREGLLPPAALRLVE